MSDGHPVHRPPVQVIPATHRVPHAPQFATSLCSPNSHPFAALPSQLPNPAAQVTPHTPAAQVAVPFVPLHAFPHLPQCATLVARVASQPFAALESQLPAPALQVNVQTAATQVGLAFSTAGHGLPHAPQSVAAVISDTHCPLQFVGVAPEQLVAHAPLLHSCPVPHAVPHLPQCATLVARVASHPFAALPSQLPKPVAQVIPHTPAVQVGVPFAPPPQAFPHLPQ